MVVQGGIYYVEIWASDTGAENTGLTSVYVDVNFPENAVSITNISHGDIFIMFTDGLAVSGVIDELGGSTLSQGVGVEPQWSRVAIVEIYIPEPSSVYTFGLLPSETGISCYGRGQIPWDDIYLGTVTIPEMTANIDGKGDVDFLDFALFALKWLNEGCDEPEWCGGADFDKSTIVDANDLKYFTEHWLE